MCGIIGYIGNRDVNEVLLNGLSRLEYRGYDSAGIAAIHGGNLSFLKESGKLQALKTLAGEKPLQGQLGVGHTRWATHGEPSVKNAHPHTDCSGSIAVVHNGIIENHEELKATLTRAGHQFSSDTDTEILAHLIESYHIQKGTDLARAVQLTLSDIKGSYAFCVVSREKDDQFVAARNGSPLVVGLGENENFVASDAPAILEYTQKAIFLEDYQMVVVEKDSVQVMSAQGSLVPYTVNTLDWKLESVEKNDYEHFMLKEIEEQPHVIRRILGFRLGDQNQINLFDHLKIDPSQLAKVERIIIQACGTSWHAALTGKFFFEALAGIPTEVDVSSEFRYRSLIPQKNTLVLSITQSGETIDTLMGLQRAKGCGLPTISICNVLGSTIARVSDGVIYTHAGPEIGVASTKAYTAQLTVLFLMSLYWGTLRGHVSSSQVDVFCSELGTISDKMQYIVDRHDRIRFIASRYFSARDFLFLGRGVNYPNAHEGALKIKEIAYIHATGHPAGEMKHGPIALIDETLPVVAIAPKSSVYEKMVSNIQEVKARHGKVISIVTEGDTSVEAHSDEVIEIPECHEFLSPLLTILPLQYLAYEVARLRGTDVDQPRNLAKSVTVE